MTWRHDKAWADRYFPHIDRLAHEHLDQKILAYNIAPWHADAHQATDLVAETRSGMDIAVRIRRPDVWRRDLTLRLWRRSGVPTEYTKIITDGYGDWYIYGWAADG